MQHISDNIQFSVLMPVYNQASFIRRAIASLMMQTYSGFELIIINDGSTDCTEQFITDYLEDKRVTYIRNETNQGLGQALNRGIDAAKYPYIAYLPADEFYEANHLEVLKDTFQKVPHTILCYSGIAYDESPEAGILAYRICIYRYILSKIIGTRR